MCTFLFTGRWTYKWEGGVYNQKFMVVHSFEIFHILCNIPCIAVYCLELNTTLCHVLVIHKHFIKWRLSNDLKMKQKNKQWTLSQFCCLAEGDELKLRAAGLGEREITLNRGWSASLLREKLSETYPKLCDGGEYEFLRTDGRSTTRLVLIPGSKTEGYSVQYLKDNLNQATAYIHPMQNNLSFMPLEDDGGLIEVSVSGVASPSNLPLE